MPGYDSATTAPNPDAEPSVRLHQVLRVHYWWAQNIEHKTLQLMMVETDNRMGIFAL